VNKETLELLRTSDALIDDTTRFVYFTRGEEFQKKAVSQLQEMRDALRNILAKEQSGKKTCADTCNRIYGQIQVYRAILGEIRMVLSLKEGDMDQAWDYLIDSQMAVTSAICAHPTYARGEMDDYGKRLHMIEEVVFPRQLFLSTGYIVKSSKCSVCDSDYGECNHIKGRVYNGRPCCRIVADCDISEISIVETPANKRCRAMHFGDGGKTMRNLMTWRKVSN